MRCKRQRRILGKSGARVPQPSMSCHEVGADVSKGSDGASPYRFPFCLLGLQFRVRDEQVPNHGLKCLGMGRDVLRIHSRNDAARVSDFGGVSTISTHDSQNRCANFFGVLEGRHQIRADIFLEISSPDRKHHERVFRLQPASFQPFDENRRPTFVVRPGSQFGYVVGRRVGLDPGDLSKVVYGVRRVCRAAADTQEKQTASAAPDIREQIDHVIEDFRIEFLHDLSCFGQVLASVGAHGRSGWWLEVSG